jgi:hypothetical protein
MRVLCKMGRIWKLMCCIARRFTQKIKLCGFQICENITESINNYTTESYNCTLITLENLFFATVFIINHVLKVLSVPKVPLITKTKF